MDDVKTRMVGARLPVELVAEAEARAEELAASTGCRATRTDVLRLALVAYLRGGGGRRCRCATGKGVAA